MRKTNEDGFLSLQLVGVACTCLCMYLYIHNLFSCKYTYIQVASSAPAVDWEKGGTHWVGVEVKKKFGGKQRFLSHMNHA